MSGTWLVMYFLSSILKTVSLLNIQFCQKRGYCGMIFTCKSTWFCMLDISMKQQFSINYELGYKFYYARVITQTWHAILFTLLWDHLNRDRN